MKIVSACLLGINCRYDDKSKPNEKVLLLSKEETLIPICPEQLGGLPTPREIHEIKNSRAISKSGIDNTNYFLKGAQEALKIAKLFNCKEAILKSKSPSCGYGLIYDGTFSGKLIKGDGVTTSLLKQNGIKVISDEEL